MEFLFCPEAKLPCGSIPSKGLVLSSFFLYLFFSLLETFSVGGCCALCYFNIVMSLKSEVLCSFLLTRNV